MSKGACFDVGFVSSRALVLLRRLSKVAAVGNLLIESRWQLMQCDSASVFSTWPWP